MVVCRPTIRVKGPRDIVYQQKFQALSLFFDFVGLREIVLGMPTKRSETT